MDNSILKEDWIKSQLEDFKGCNETVIKFIADILYHAYPYNNKCTDDIRKLFRAGYCYYFAIILKEAFQRGTVCNVGGRGHIVWVDGEDLNNDIAYDIEGVYYAYDDDELIPVEFFGDLINDFKHVEGAGYDASKEEIEEKINAWKKQKRD